MAKLILALDGTVLREVMLAKGQIRIGRHPHNDIVIDDPAVSGEHAVVVRQPDGALLEDLNSTNGTQVNGQPVRRHFLQDGDVVVIARYRIAYSSDEPTAPAGSPPVPGQAGIEVVEGPAAGRRLALDKPLTTFGRPGAEIAVIARRGDDYYLAHVEGTNCPSVNGHPVDERAVSLEDGDLIEFSATRLRFSVT
jgi:pSer/pThr/pTyr-binding forkhead associated (FHA) protein